MSRVLQDLRLLLVVRRPLRRRGMEYPGVRTGGEKAPAAQAAMPTVGSRLGFRLAMQA